MADIRIKDLATTATTTASGDFMAVDGTTNGTRKLSAAAPAFLTSVTTPSLTSPAATPLTLGTGTSGAAITMLSASNDVGIGTVSPAKKLDVNGDAVFGAAATRLTTYSDSTYSGIFNGASLGSAESIYMGLGALFFIGGGTERMRIASTGTVSIASTTAGSSGVGALVVQGGISAGQSAQASFIGGNLTVGAQTGALSLPDKPDSLIMSLGYPATSTPTNQQLKISLGNVSGTEAYGFTTDNIARVWYHAGNSSSGSGGHVLATGGTARLTIDGTTATFAGAVAIGGNVGFYNASPVAKPTGVAVTAAAIHAALVTLNLIAA